MCYDADEFEKKPVNLHISENADSSDRRIQIVKEN